jgi:hypothetical protein
MNVARCRRYSLGSMRTYSGSTSIAAQLVPKLSTRLIQIPEGSQLGQLSEDQICCLCIPSCF